MQEQQINQKYCPPQSERLEQVDHVSQGKQRSQQIATRRLKQLHRFLPQAFTPYLNIANNYNNINQQSNTIRLNSGHPEFSLNSLIYDRQRLSIQRQMMYCRGAVVEEIMCEGVVEGMIKESGLQRGYVNKQGNKSVIVDGMLVYVHGENIKAIVLPYYNRSNNNNNINREIEVYEQSMNPMTLYSFQKGTQILQLQLFSATNNKDHQFYTNIKKNNHISNNQFNIDNNNNNPILLSLRLARQIVILNLSQQQVIHSIPTQSNTQFICSQKSIYSFNTLQTVEYDGVDSVVKRWDLEQRNYKNIYIKQNNQSLFTIKGMLVHSMNKLTRNQSILASYQGLSVCDFRQKHLTTVYSVSNAKNNLVSSQSSNDRIYSSIRISSNYTYTPYLATCNTRHICLFDIRNLSQPIQRRLHHFQQAPPENMVYFDGLQERLDKGVIVGWNSWSKNGGVGMMTQVNADGFNDGGVKQQEVRNQFILGKHFQLISSNNNNNNNQNKKPSSPSLSFISSISPYNYSQQTLALFSTTNQGAINIHLYHHNGIKQKFQPQQVLYDQQQSVKQKMTKSLEYQNSNSSQKWLRTNLCDKYFTKVVGYEKKKQQSKQGEKMTKPQLATSNIKKKKKAKPNNTSLIISNKDKNKKKNTNSNSNKSITENIHINNFDEQKQKIDWIMIDQQQFLLDTGEYENEQQCEQSYSKRKLNFADLTKFYTTLKTKARQLQKQNYIPSKSKNINSKNDFDSSLTSTQPYSQSFSLSQSFSDDFFKTYTFHNKKVLNTSMLDKLKTQWQL